MGGGTEVRLDSCLGKEEGLHHIWWRQNYQGLVTSVDVSAKEISRLRD